MKPELQSGQLIVTDGDSMTSRRSVGNPDTWPFLRLMNWDRVWPDLMAEILFCWRAELNLSFFNAASSGSSCRGMIERLETNVIARKPQWVIASVAGNDVRLGISVDEFHETMTTYATRLTQDADAQVLFFGITQRDADYPKADTLKARCDMYAALNAIADGMDGVFYEDIGPDLAAKAAALKDQCSIHTIYGDEGHFNSVGHMLVAGEILRIFGVVNDETKR